MNDLMGPLRRSLGLPEHRLMRFYEPAECNGVKGYPPEWHATIKHQVREEAEHRCVRCGHPYTRSAAIIEPDPETGKPVNWSPCGEFCNHTGPIRAREISGKWMVYEGIEAGPLLALAGIEKQASWRILTVHHLDEVKGNCRWWNLVALCQRCHLQIQGKVQMQRVWAWEHSDWFKPYVAGFYAFSYLRLELSRAEVMARLDELLDLERA